MTIQKHAIGSIAVCALLAQFVVAQGQGAQDLAPIGGNHEAVGTAGTPRGQAEGLNVIGTPGPYVTHVGGGFAGGDASSLQNVSRAHSIFGYSANGTPGVVGGGFRLADDFSVPAGQMWYVDTIKVFAYRTVVAGAAPVTFTTGVLRIWDGAPNGGGVVVFGDAVTNRLVASGPAVDAFRALEGTLLNNQRQCVETVLTVGRLFKPGNYWVEWGLNDALLSTVFAPPVTVSNVDVTGNGLQLAVGSGVWTPLLTGLATNNWFQGVPMVICGEAACCFENDMGPALTPTGDDVAYRALVVPSFAMPGGLGNTTSIDVCTNGYVYLQSNLLGADFSPTEAELRSNPARICAPWNDMHSGLGGSVRLRTTALRTIVTWARVPTFSLSTSQNIVQLQMFPNGSFTINSWLVTDGPSSWNTPVFGVSPGNLAADPGETNFSAAMPFSSAVGTVYEQFSNNAGVDRYDLNGQLICFAPNAGGGFDVSSTPACCTFASSTLVGPGCFGMTTIVTQNAIAGGTAVMNSVLPPGTIGQVTLLGLVPAPFFLPLAGAGAPGCFIHHTNDLFSVPMDAAGVSLIPLPCLSALLGFPLGAQGVSITPAINALNVAVGDGWALVIGNL